MPNMDQSPMAIIDMYDTGQEIQDIMEEKQILEDACSLEEIISEQGELNNELIASVESAYPGLLLDNLTLEECHTDEGVTYALESIADIKDKTVVSISVSSILLINKLKKFLNRIKDSDVADGVVAMLATVKSTAGTIKEGVIPSEETKYLKEYKKFMGSDAESLDMVKQFITDIKNAKHPITVLKDYPNNEYDVIFTPLLSDTVSETNHVYALFSLLREKHAQDLVTSIEQVQTALFNIIESEDYGRLARLNDNIIPKSLHDTLNDIVGAYNIELNPKEPLLDQVSLIGKQFASALKPTEESLNKKATVVNALVHQSKKLDTAYDDILKTTDTLSQFDKKKADQLVRIKEELTVLKRRKSLKARAVGIKDGTHKASVMQYRRIVTEINHLWGLVNLFSRMSVVFVTKHATIVKTLTEFNLRLTMFIKAVEKIQSQSSDKPEVSSPSNTNDEGETGDE